MGPFTVYELIIIMGIPSVLTFGYQTFYAKLSKRLKETREDELVIKKGLQALLRDRLRQNYIQYMQDGVIDLADKENFENLYNSYHQMGVNGVMDEMYKQVMCLPIMRKIDVPKHIEENCRDSF